MANITELNGAEQEGLTILPLCTSLDNLVICLSETIGIISVS